MRKRKFFNSAFLIAAFSLAVSNVFVSCKDYDDDISDLRNEITSTATTLEELVNEKSANAEKEIAALNSQVSALETAYKQADADLQTAIVEATNDAKGYADIQAAEAEKAAIAAAQKLVDEAAANLQDGLDAANATIDEQGKTIQSLLAADVELQKGIDAAQAKADAAYNLAAQANATAEDNKSELGKVAENLKTINETLSGQINVLGTQISAVEAQANQNAADILKQETALADLKKSNEDALGKLNAADDVLNGLITKNQQDIDALQTKVDEAKKAAEKALTDAKAYTDAEIAKVMELLQGSETVEGVNVRLTNLENAYKAADEALAEDIEALEKRVKANETAISTINTAISKINSTLAQLINDNVNNLITSIIYQDRYSTNVYAKVTGNTSTTDINTYTKDGVSYAFFPYTGAKGYTELTVGHYNVQEWAGYVYATINPQDIDASKADIYLENSLMAKPQHGYTLGKAEVAEGHLIKTRALSSANGLWRLPVTTTATDVEEDPEENVDEAAYALYTTYEQDILDADGNVQKVEKKVYSHYAIALNPEKAEAAQATDLSLLGTGKTCTKEGQAATDRIEYNAPNGDIILGTNGKRVYKKYIECISVKNNGVEVAKGAETFNSANPEVLQTVLTAEDEGKDDTKSLECPASLINKVITLKYYIWNYDGSIKIMTKDVVFNETLWDDVETTMKVTPDNGTSVSAFSAEFPGFAFVKGEVSEKTGNKWSAEARGVKATVETGDAAINGATINLMGSDKQTIHKSVIVGAATGISEFSSTELSNLDKIKEMQVVVDPGKLVPEHEYKITLTFYNKEGFVVNNVIIKYTLEIPTGKPDPWHIAAAFDSSDKLTIAWASAPDNYSYTATSLVFADAVYAFSGSFYNVNNGFTADSPYYFELTDAANYDTGKQYAAYKPAATGMPATTAYTMQVPAAALNGEPETEHVYKMTAGIQFFGLQNLISCDTEKGWNDKFEIKFLSPIRYAILGTKGYIDGKTYEGIATTKDITVEYRKSVVIDDELFAAIDPKEAKSTPVYFFKGIEATDSRDSRIVSTKLEFAEVNSNNALFSGITDNNDGTYTLVTSDKVSVTSNTVVKFKLTVTDVWGAVTTYTFPVTVIANK